MGYISKIRAAFFAALLLVCAFGLAEAADARELRVTLYDTVRGKVVAAGRAPLLPRETRAKLYAVAKAPGISSLPYTRDEVYVTLIRTNPVTGLTSFRVRYQRIENKICTAMEIRDYHGIARGETRELISERGKIRALMRLS